MAFLDTRGLYTLTDLFYDTFAKRNDNKFFTGTSEPDYYVPDNSLYAEIGASLEVVPLHGDGAVTINGIETDGLTGNVQLPGYIERYKIYYPGDTVLSMKLPGGYWLECTEGGLTNYAENESYAKE